MPTRVGSPAYTSATTTTTNASLPNTATAGNLLIFGVVLGRSNTSNTTCSTPTGFTAGPSALTTSGSVRIGVYTFWKVAAGGETSASFTVPTSSLQGQFIAEEWSGLSNSPHDSDGTGITTTSTGTGLSLSDSITTGGTNRWLWSVLGEVASSGSSALTNIAWTSPLAADAAVNGQNLSRIATGAGIFPSSGANTPTVVFDSSTSSVSKALCTMAFIEAPSVSGTASVTLGGLTVASTGMLGTTGTVNLGGLTVTALPSPRASFPLGGLTVDAVPEFRVRFLLGSLQVDASTPTVEIPVDFYLELSSPISLAFDLSVDVESGATAVDNELTNLDHNYDPFDTTLHSNRRLLPDVYITLPTPVIIKGRPMLPAYIGRFDSSMTAVQGSGHIRAIQLPEPDTDGKPDTKPPNNDGGGHARWTVDDLPDPADYEDGWYWLGIASSEDGSDDYPDAQTHLWQAHGTSTMIDPPSWYSRYPWKPVVTDHTWYGPNGNIQTVTKGVRFHPHRIQHMWIDMGAGDGSSPPLTWVVVGLIQNFDYDAQGHHILDSGKDPWDSGVDWTLDDMNKIIRLGADPNNYRLALKANHDRLAAHTSMETGQHTIRTEFVHDYKPKMFFVVVNDDESMSGYYAPEGRRIKRGTIDSGHNLRHLVMGRQNGILSRLHAAHLVVFEMRMWNRALDRDELREQYHQLASTWKLHKYY